MPEADAILWAWSGVGPHPLPPAGGFAAWVGPDGPVMARVDGGSVPAAGERVEALLAATGGAAAVGGWVFVGRVRGRAILEYRATGAASPEGADAGLPPAAAFLCDRAAEVAATGAPWWTAWRQAAAALCETYEGCAFDLAWTDGAVVLALVQTVAVTLSLAGVLAPAGDGSAAGALARGRAELARLGLYAGGRCLCVAPITGGA